MSRKPKRRARAKRRRTPTTKPLFKLTALVDRNDPQHIFVALAANAVSAFDVRCVPSRPTKEHRELVRQAKALQRVLKSARTQLDAVNSDLPDPLRVLESPR